MGWLILTLVSLPIQHCRNQEVRTLDPALVFFPAEEGEGFERTPADPRDREPVPLADRFVAQLPRDPGPWRWAAADGVTLAAFFRGEEPKVLVYAEGMGTGPWSSLGLDRFLRTVAPALSSPALPLFDGSSTHLRSGLEEELDLEPMAAVDLLSRLRSRTLGRGLGFHGHRASFSGWRWSGRNRHGVELRLGALEGLWGKQDELPAPLEQALTSLRARGLVPELSSAERRPGSTRDRAARLVLGTVQRRSIPGVYLAILHTAEPEPALLTDLAAILDTVRLPRADEMESLLAARTSGDLERLSLSLRLDLQVAPRQLTEEGWGTLAEALKTTRSAPR